MHADTLSLQYLFEVPRRYLVPLFQRPYVWTKGHEWRPLWSDVLYVAEKLLHGEAIRPHFMGTIVLDQLRIPAASFDSRQVIDGQQRLITLQILLVALQDLAGKTGLEDHASAFALLTANRDPMSKDPDAVFKVWPTNADRVAFKQVLTAGAPLTVRSRFGAEGAQTTGNALADAYLFFYRQAQIWAKDGEEGREQRLRILLDCLRHYLRFVVIDLDQGDDPQMIFETLNARGTPLGPTDLIKNYLFHRASLEEAKLAKLYEEYWRPFDDEQSFWREMIRQGRLKRPRVDMFLQHYLTHQSGSDVLADHLYSSFKAHVEADSTSAKEHLDSIAKYAAVFRRIQTFPPHDSVGRFLERLRTMDVSTVYPLLMEVFLQREEASLGHDQLLLILRGLESFLVRRMVCHLTTKGYNRLFVDLLRHLQRKEGVHAKSAMRFLASQEADSRYWPGDKEFRAAWLSEPVYRRLVRRRVRMLLEALEHELLTRKSEEIEILESLTIEHLMPREWKEHWPLPEGSSELEAAERRRQLIDTIGNLTLVTKSLNPALSNAPWAEKRPAIADNSALALNRAIAKLDDWSEDAIEKRGEESFELAISLWPAPEKLVPELSD